MDFIQSFPIFTLIQFHCQQSKINYCMNYNMNDKQILLIIFTAIKQFKFYKLINQKTNSVLFRLYEFQMKKYYQKK